MKPEEGWGEIDRVGGRKLCRQYTNSIARTYYNIYFNVPRCLYKHGAAVLLQTTVKLKKKKISVEFIHSKQKPVVVVFVEDLPRWMRNVELRTYTSKTKLPRNIASARGIFYLPTAAATKTNGYSAT